MDTSYIKNLTGPIAIVGMGKSGLSALNLLREAGFSDKDLLTYDDRDSTAQFKNPVQLMEKLPKTFVVSPGVPLSTAWIQTAILHGAHLTSEISLAASLITTENVIGVTGSVAKSTVVSLLGAGVRSFAPTSFVGGNIGTPFCDYAQQLLRGGEPTPWVVLELSSFQLENCKNLSVDFSIITYLSANHLERYSSLEEYYQTKLKITSITKEVCLFGGSSKDAVRYSKQSSSRFKIVDSKNFSHPEYLQQVCMIGSHNKDNFALAAEMANLCKWPAGALTEMAHYKGLPHRLEYVATLNDVTFINDSKATAMDSVLAAVKGCLENIRPPSLLFLLLGGKDKNLPWEDLADLAAKENIVPVFFGACGSLAKEKSGLIGEYFEKLGSAINYCQKRARPMDSVLLSPGGTSLDEFKNFEERGDFFKTLVLSNVEA